MVGINTVYLLIAFVAISSSTDVTVRLEPQVVDQVRLITAAVEHVLQAASQVWSLQLIFVGKGDRNSVDLQWQYAVVGASSSRTLEIQKFQTFSQRDADRVGHSATKKHTTHDRVVIALIDAEPSEAPLRYFGESSGKRYFIIVRTDDQPSLLLSPAVLRLKFKLELRFSRLKEDDTSFAVAKIVQGWTICFYCNGGQSQLVQLNLQEARRMTEIFPDFNRNMNGTMLLIVSSKGLEKSISFHEAENGSIELRDGFSNNILRCLQKKYNFRYSVSLRNGFGKMLENGTFNGVVGALQSEEAEYTMDIGSSVDRFKTVTFMPMTVHAGAVFFTRIPAQVTDWHLVYRPFQKALWLLLLGSVAIVALVELILVALTRQIEDEKSSISYTHVFGGSVGYLLRHLVEQCIEHCLSERYKVVNVIGVAWIFAAVIISTAYKAKLTTLRAYAPEEDIPRNFAELSESNFEIILHYVGGIFLKGFETSTNPVLRRVAMRLILEKSLLRCFEAAISRDAACITMNINGVYAGYKNFSSVDGELMLRTSEDQSFPLLGGPAAKKGAVFAEEFAGTIRQMFDMGLVRRFQEDEDSLQRHKGKMWAKLKVDDENWRKASHDGPQPIVMRELLVLYLIVVVIFVASLLIVMGEVHFLKIQARLVLRREPEGSNYDPIPEARSSVTSDTFTINTLLRSVSPTCSELDSKNCKTTCEYFQT